MIVSSYITGSISLPKFVSWFLKGNRGRRQRDSNKYNFDKDGFDAAKIIRKSKHDRRRIEWKHELAHMSNWTTFSTKNNYR